MSALSVGTLTGHRPGIDHKPSLKVVLLYEDKTTGFRALRTCQRVQARLDDGVEFEFFGWEFPSIEQVDVCVAAAEQMRSADLIIVSAHSGETFTEGLRDCFDLFLFGDCWRRCALMEQFDAPESIPSEGTLFLERVAALGGLDLIGRQGV